MGVIKDWIFQNAVTVVGNGDEYIIPSVAANGTIGISISGTATSRTVVFEGKGLNGNYIGIKAYNETTGSLATQTTGTTDEKWVIGLTGWVSIRCRISSISGGNLSISGRVCD
jgi:hypothetical protein